MDHVENPASEQGVPSNFSDLYDVRETLNTVFYSDSVNFILVLPFILTHRKTVLFEKQYFIIFQN